jgi:hypothetical protein
VDAVAFALVAFVTSVLLSLWRVCVDAPVLSIALAGLVLGAMGLATENAISTPLSAAALLASQLTLGYRLRRGSPLAKVWNERSSEPAGRSGAASQPPDEPNGVEAEIRARAQKANVGSLLRRGVREIGVLDMRTIESIVQRAVAGALEASHARMSAALRSEVEREAKRDFLELMDRHERALVEKTDVERHRADLADQVARLRSELARQQAELEERRSEKGVMISPESHAELEQTLQRVLAGFLETASGKLDAASLESSLGECLDGLMGRVKSSYEDLLERRIEKLNKALAQTEQELVELASAKSIDLGVPSLYRTVQGLSPETAHFERKKSLLALVFLENLEIQGREITEQDRALAQSPEVALGPEVLGFAPPLDPLTTETAF